MAEEKLTINELKRIISKQMSFPEETATRFLNALIPAILDGLRTDQQVRISGLGSFKLVRIAPRKSVNVNTGESVMLDGYNKVTFVPESYIREQINEPFADMEIVQVDEKGQPLDPQSTLPGIDPMHRFDIQATEIKNILAELDKQNEEHAAKEEEQKKKEQQKKEEQLKKEVRKEAKKPADNAADKADKPAKKPSKKRVKKMVTQEQKEYHTEYRKKPSRFNGWMVALITMLVLLGMLVVGYFVLVNKLENWAGKLGMRADEEELFAPEPETEVLDIEPLLPIDTMVPDSLAQDSLVVVDTIKPEPTLLGIETVKAGSRLAQIARRYYGDPNKWTIIYDENKNEIKDPNNLKAGTRLRIPKLKD